MAKIIRITDERVFPDFDISKVLLSAERARQIKERYGLSQEVEAVMETEDSLLIMLATGKWICIDGSEFEDYGKDN